MNSETVVMCVVALILGMLLAHMLKSVCGCGDVVEGYLRAGAHGKGICCCGDEKADRSSDGKCDKCDDYTCFNHTDCYKINWDNTSTDFKPPKGAATATAVPLCAGVKGAAAAVGECFYVEDLPWPNNTETFNHLLPDVTKEYCDSKSGEWTKTQ